MRWIARSLGRSPSTISREVHRNGGPERYRATRFDQAAWDRARRPKRCKLACRPDLARTVSAKLRRNWSPEQIAGWLKRTWPGEPHNQVSHETIYRSLFIQTRGVLKKELLDHLRARRTIRRSRHASLKRQGLGQIKDAVSISERPACVEDRAVPGHWEGDLVSGSRNSYVASLVERRSRYLMLVRLRHWPTTYGRWTSCTTSCSTGARSASWRSSTCSVGSPRRLIPASPTAPDVVETLDRAAAVTGYPRTIRVDNGPEFVSRDLDLWAFQNGVTLDFSRPGKRTDNAFAESCSGKARAECLNTAWFLSLDDARRKCEAWLREYNEERPHSSIGDKCPIELMNGAGPHGPSGAQPPRRSGSARSNIGVKVTINIHDETKAQHDYSTYVRD